MYLCMFTYTARATPTHTGDVVLDSGGVVLDSGGVRRWKTFVALNFVLQHLGMSVEEEGAGAGAGDGEEGPPPIDLKGGPWVVRKGAWSQPFEDKMRVSAFPSRNWPQWIKPALANLPRDFSPLDLKKPAAAGGSGAGAGAVGTKRQLPSVRQGANKWCVGDVA